MFLLFYSIINPLFRQVPVLKCKKNATGILYLVAGTQQEKQFAGRLEKKMKKNFTEGMKL